MGWETIIRLVLTYGVDTAFRIWEIYQRFPEGPTAQAWDELRALALKPYDAYIDEARARAAAATPPSASPS